MDPRIPPTRPDTVAIASAPRVTPSPVRVPFAQVLAGGARTLVRGAEAAVTALPGGPMMALALRNGVAADAIAPVAGLGKSPNLAVTAGAGAEGPSAGAAGAQGAGGEPAVESSLAQAQEMNLYYLQIQEQVNAQNRSFTALSNVLKAEHDTVKTAIGNIR
jgi:hypothetical protein